MKPYRPLLSFFLSLSLISSVSAQFKEKIFMVQVRTDRGEVPMAFHERPSDYGRFIGYHRYKKPSIPIDTEGELYIPDSVTAPDGQCLPVCWISRGAFQGCQNLTKISLPHTLEYISDYSLQDCTSLREIILSDSLKIIYPQAFIGCNALQRIVVRGSRPPDSYNDSGFSEDVRNTATVVFPPASEKAYKTNNVFEFFRYHVNLLPTYPKQQP